jgi:predicted membrane metal-binding protein
VARCFWAGFPNLESGPGALSVAAMIILVLALGAVSEIVLPLTFAASLIEVGQLIMQTQMYRRTT